MFDEDTLAYLAVAPIMNKKHFILLTMVNIMPRVNKLGGLSSLSLKYCISIVHLKVIHSGRTLPCLQMLDKNTLAYLAAESTTN
jgi:hypothetical protein